MHQTLLCIKTSDMKKSFLRPRNIILMLLTLCCLGGCCFVAVKTNDAENDYRHRVESLPELTTTAQIIDAVKSQQPKLYVINGYKFPKYELVSDPYHNVAEGYLYISVSVSSKGSDNKYHDNPNLEKEVYGKLFFDDNTELQNFDHSIVSTAGKTNDHKRGNDKYYYGLLSPDAELSFIAELGNNQAKVSGFDGDCNVVEGNKERLVSSSATATSFLLYKIALAVAIIILAILMIADYQDIKEKEQKRLNRQRSKAGNKKNADFFKKK